MIVTCSNCDTKYNLPEDKIAPGGSKVKCSKCGHQFKVEPPTLPAEEEVEALLEDEAPAPDKDVGDDFDEEFGEALADDAEEAAPEESAPPEAPDDEDQELDIEDPLEGTADTGVDAPPTDEDDFGDLFDDQEEQEDAPGGDESLLEGDEGDLFEEGADDDDELPGSDRGDEEEGLGGLFDDEEDDDEGDDDIFDDEDDEDDEDEGLFDDDLDLDDKPRRKGLGLLITLLVIVLLGAAVYFFKPWTMLGADFAGTMSNIPWIGSLFTDDMPEAEPGESPENKVKNIELKNVRQFYVKNEKAGVLFVIQGTAVNKFTNPRERIKVKAELFDAKGVVVASDSLLCGNQLSMFQLQVQSRQEIEEGLKSEVGVLSNNTFLRPGASTPFMFVFFEQPVNDIKEFVVKVVGAEVPE